MQGNLSTGTMRTGRFKKHVEENYPECLFLDGYDRAILGLVVAASGVFAVCYDKNKIILELQEKNHSLEQALEFMETLIADSSPANGGPVFISPLDAF